MYSVKTAGTSSRGYGSRTRASARCSRPPGGSRAPAAARRTGARRSPPCRPPARKAGRSAVLSANISSRPRSRMMSLAGGRPLDLHHDPLAGRSRVARWTSAIVPAAMGVGSMRLEHVLPRDPQLLLHHPDHLLLGERGDAVLQRGELLDERRGKEVGPGREDLAELGERRPQLLQGAAQSARRPRAGGLPVVLAAREQLPEAVAGHDAADRRGPPEQATFDGDAWPARPPGSASGAGGTVRAVPRGGVDDDHGASGVVARRGWARCRAGTPCARSCRRCRPRRRRRPRNAAASTMARAGSVSTTTLARPRAPAIRRASC